MIEPSVIYNIRQVSENCNSSQNVHELAKKGCGLFDYLPKSESADLHWKAYKILTNGS